MSCREALSQWDTLPGMADHYLRSVELLDEAAQARKELRDVVNEPPPPVPDGALATQRQRKLERLSSTSSTCIKAAHVHALLSIAQRLDDLGAAR